MKKIAIITIIDNNLGNRLQNYAMQSVLSKYGEVETIKFDLNNKDKTSLMVCLKNLISSFVYRAFFLKYEKKINYIKFNCNNIKFSRFQFCKSINYKKMNKYFDYFIVGSDQIWNPNFFDDDMYFQMLGFANSNKKYSIAPSIAVDSLTDKQIKIFKKYLHDFQFLSAREEQGSKLLSEILNRKVETLIDPTLMLNKEEWLKIEKKPKGHKNKKYILLYFLGTITDDYQKKISTIKTFLNLDIINLNDHNDIYYKSGPAEFLWLIHNASVVLTDSFHGTIFSYIFEKPVRIFNRVGSKNNMNSRLLNLVDVLKFNPNVFINNHFQVESILDFHYDKSYLINEQNKFIGCCEKIFGD